MSDQARSAARSLIEGLRPGSTWSQARWDRLFAVLRVAAEDEAEEAAELLAHVWPLVPADADPDRCRRLHDLGVELAAGLPESPVLARAFRHGAEAFRARGAHRLAAYQGMHELAIRRVLDDPDAHEDALSSLAATYRAQGRVHRVIGCADEVLALRLRLDDRPGVARALTALGSVMVEVGRFDSAVNYLARADTAFDGLPGVEADRAECRVLRGRALWGSGDHAAARRQFGRALETLTGERARRVRALLDVPPGEDLPAP